MFALTSDSAMVYAGDVISGEHCATELTGKLNAMKTRGSGTRLHIAQRTFQCVYKHRKTSRQSPVYDLHILIGICSKDGVANLIYFTSPEFEPRFLEGMHGIGDMRAYTDLQRRVNEEIEKGVSEELAMYDEHPEFRCLHVPTSNNAMHVGMTIAGVMHDQVITDPIYRTVGGPMQFAILDARGITGHTLSFTKDPTGASDTWHKATAQPSELTTFQAKYGLRRVFSNTRSFGLYSFSN